MSFPSNTPDKPDVILHIGAGMCSELDRWLTTGAKRVVLFEPNPERARALVANAGENKRIEVAQKAVAGESGQLRLNLFNLPALSSLREPTGLLGLFPGLHTEREVEVDAITPTELIETTQLAPDSNHWLIIDTPGEEAAIVNALHAADQLPRFNRVILHCGTEPLYNDNPPAATLLDQLQEAGYDIEQQDDTDPDRPCWLLHRNPVRLENEALRQRIAELEQQTKELAEARDKATASAKRAEEDLAKRDNEIQKLKTKLSRQSEDVVKLRESVERGEASLASERELRTRLDTEFARADAQLNLLVQLMTGNADGEGRAPGNSLSSDGRLDFYDENDEAEPDPSGNDQK